MRKDASRCLAGSLHESALTAIPMYQRIGDDLRQRIAQGEWPVGAKLPGRQALAQHYGVDLRTLQRAMASLLEDGTCRAVDRQGTYVSALPRGVEVSAPASEPSLPRESLPPAHSATLGVVAALGYDATELPRHQHEWTPTLLDIIEREFSTHGGRTHFCNAQPPAWPDPSWPQAIRSLLNAGVDALALVDLHGLCRDQIAELYRLATAARTPVVYITWAEVTAVPITHIFYDQRQAGFQAAQHLLQEGYRAFYLLAPYRAEWLSERIAGVRSAIQVAGMPEDVLRLSATQSAPFVNETNMDLVELTVRQAVTADGLFAQDAALPFAIIAPNDVYAYKLLTVAGEAGKVAGRDFGLIGFDDYPRSRTLGLSTMRPPLETMGETVARMILRALHGEEMPVQVRLRSQLIARLSTFRHRAEIPPAG